MPDFDRSMNSLVEAANSMGDTFDAIDALLVMRDAEGMTPFLEAAYFEQLDTLIADIGFAIQAGKIARTAIRAYLQAHRPSAP